MPTTSTGLLTDRYELTMVDAALRAGIAARPSVALSEPAERQSNPGRRCNHFMMASTAQSTALVDANNKSTERGTRRVGEISLRSSRSGVVILFWLFSP